VNNTSKAPTTLAVARSSARSRLHRSLIPGSSLRSDLARDTLPDAPQWPGGRSRLVDTNKHSHSS